MAVNPNWPMVVTQFNLADPFDPAAAPNYKAFNPQPESVSASGGRQYELDLVQAGEATFKLFDQAETLNPANTSSPFYPNVKPLRQIIDQAMWPPAPVGGATNLLWGQGIDPSFESYTAGSLPSWVLYQLLTTGPTITTTTPQQGTKSLTYTVANPNNWAGVGLSFNCIPGQQYTASAWVRQTAANPTEIFIASGAAGTTTTVTGSYVRLTVTWTATNLIHQVWVGAPSTTLSSTVNVDAFQVEPGAAVTAFATSGPTIYGVFGGFIERYPRTWKDGGVRGMASLTCVDAFAILANQALETEYVNAVLAKNPAYYWRLNEGQGARTFAEISGNNGPPLVRIDSTFGPAPSFGPGTQTNIPGDPGGSGVAIGTAASFGSAVPSSGLQTGLNRTPLLTLGGAQPTWALTLSFWFTTSTSSNYGPILELFDGAARNRYIELINSAQLGVDTLFVQLWNKQGGIPANNTEQIGGSLPGTPFLWGDGQPHQYIVVFEQTQTTFLQITVYVDGLQVVQNFFNPSVDFDAGVSFKMDTIELCGDYSQVQSSSYNTSGMNGTYAHLAAWNRVLANSEINDLWSAGKSGYLNDYPGKRIARYLAYNWIGPTAIDTGTSLMGVSNLAANTSILDACQAVNTSENGRLFVDPNSGGVPTFQARTRQYLNTTAKWVMGERTDLGELPYEEDFATDFDPQQVATDVQVTRVGGIAAIGGTQAAVAAARKASGKRTYTRTVNTVSDAETQDAADWIFAGHANATQRIAAISIEPSSNPALWPMALGARQGDRVTVHRRTSAGTPMVNDYFIERIEHDRKVSDTALEWVVKFQMSPASLNLQPGIFDDAQFGIFNQTLVFGY